MKGHRDAARRMLECFALPTQTSENGIRLNETDKDGYSLLFEKEMQQRSKKQDR